MICILQTTAFLFVFGHVCHGIAVGLSADISTASATLPALSLVLFYHIFSAEYEGFANNKETFYFVYPMYSMYQLRQTEQKNLQVSLQVFDWIS